MWSLAFLHAGSALKPSLWHSQRLLQKSDTATNAEIITRPSQHQENSPVRQKNEAQKDSVLVPASDDPALHDSVSVN
jgi:hypothetical protein